VLNWNQKHFISVPSNSDLGHARRRHIKLAPFVFLRLRWTGLKV